VRKILAHAAHAGGGETGKWIVAHDEAHAKVVVKAIGVETIFILMNLPIEQHS